MDRIKFSFIGLNFRFYALFFKGAIGFNWHIRIQTGNPSISPLIQKPYLKAGKRVVLNDVQA